MLCARCLKLHILCLEGLRNKLVEDEITKLRRDVERHRFLVDANIDSSTHAVIQLR